MKIITMLLVIISGAFLGQNVCGDIPLANWVFGALTGITCILISLSEW
jgi:hypothetical protein